MTTRPIHFFKISISIILIVISLWALFLPPLFPSSTRALVNANIYRVNAPIPGLVKDIKALDRQHLEPGELIATLERDQEKTLEEASLLRLDIVQTQLELDAVRAALEEQNSQSSARTSTELERSIYELGLTKLQRKDSLDAFSIAQESEARIIELHDQNVVTFADLQQARAATLEASQRLTGLEKDLNNLERSIVSLSSSSSQGQQQGQNFQDSQAKSLGLREVTLSAQVQASQQRLKQLLDLIESGAEQIIVATRGGILWQANVIEGQTVSRGDALFTIAQDDNLFVEAYLARHFLDSVAIGDRAVVYLNDDKTFHEGTITSIQSQEQDDSRQHAIPSVAPNIFTLKLTIALTDQSIGIDKLGRLSKVIITSANPSLPERIMIRLSLLLRAST